MSFKFSTRSRSKLEGVHPDLVKVMEHAILHSPVDFSITEGVRTIEKQRQFVASGASTTMNSRHIPGRDGYSKAVDVAAWVGREVRWDWPLYHKIAAAVKESARVLGIPIEWSGDWKSFPDGPHFQLPRKEYP